MKNKIYLLIILCVQITKSNAQVTTIPYFPTDKDTVKLIFDATQGNAALANTDTIVYIHTGVITNLSTSNSNWKYVKFPNWPTNDPSILLKPLGNNKFLWICPGSIRSFYGVPTTEKILNMVMVFRNKTGTIVGKTADSKDILVPIYDGSLHTKILRPLLNPSSPFVDSSTAVLNVLARTSKKCTVSLFLNNKLVKNVNADSISTSLSNFSFGNNWIKVSASDGVSTVADSMLVILTPKPQQLALPAGAKDGITYLNDSTVIFNLYAPGKKNIYILGDFNNWSPNSNYLMNISPDNTRFWLQVSGLKAKVEYAYQYFIDKSLKVADSYSEKVLDPWNDKYISSTVYPNLKPYPANASGIVSVLQTAQAPYPWQINSFVKPNKTDLVIYELHMRDFLGLAPNYAVLKDTLGYFKRLGINAIELMPINEFEGNDSWGYNPDYYFAPDKYYGTKDNLKAFIDKAHSMGIAVIIDIALNHSFGQSPMAQMYWDNANNRPAANNPWFNQTPTHPFNVGNDFNHQSPATKVLVRNVVSYWVTEFKIDGYRFDLSKGFTQKVTTTPDAFSQLDTSRVTIWKGIADYIWKNDPTTYIILEHLAYNQEETLLSNYGIMLWGNLNNAYCQASMGYADNSSDFGWANYKTRGWAKPNAVVYMESHDEERMLYKNLNFGTSDPTTNYSVKDTTTAHSRAGLAAAFFFTIPGPKMIWEFGELGYDYSINYNTRVGRKPTTWNYFNVLPKRKLFNIYAAMIKLKTSQAAFRTTNIQQTTTGAFKHITLIDSTMSVKVVGNFGVLPGSMNPYFPSSGTWYDYFSGDSIIVTDLYAKIALTPGEYHVFTSKKLARPDLSLGLRENTEAPSSWTLLNYPNPAASTTSISLDIRETNTVSVKIFNVVGEEVKTFNPKKFSPGKYELEWDLKSNPGTAVPNGVYFINVQSGNAFKTAKMLVNQ